MTRRQRRRERCAYNKWRRWARVNGYDAEEACSWADHVKYLLRWEGYLPMTSARRLRVPMEQKWYLIRERTRIQSEANW